MAEIVICEFMDEAAISRMAAQREVHKDFGLADRQGEIPALLADCRALIVRNRTQVSAQLLDAAPKLECVGRLGVGLDNIDVEACKARGVAVYPASGANDLSVAEYVITAALVLRRGAWFASARVASGEWPRQSSIGMELEASTLGLVGFGAIARLTARKAAALGMRVIAYDPFLDDGHEAWALAGRRTLDGVLEEADVVSLHTPLTPQTRHMIAAAQISRMKKDAILVNAARGGVVDEDALANALRQGRIGGAALDCFEEEPLPAAGGKRFAGLANVILTPHIAGVTVESNVRVSDRIASLVLDHLGGTK
jgi:(S)-sulfolactate dehydrogenase